MAESRAGEGGERAHVRWHATLHERLEVKAQLVLGHAEIVVEQVEQLLLHERDLGEREEGGVFGPVLVFGRRVVEIFGRNNERRKEHAMPSAVHA